MGTFKYIQAIVAASTLSQTPTVVSAQTTGNVAEHFKNAYAAAGTEHFNLYNMICPRIENSSAGKIATPPDARNGSIDNAVAKKVFDNLYYVGEYYFWESSASSWLVDTGDGLVLIDALYPDSVHVIEKGVEEMGFDMKDIKYLIVGHAHADHYGGARYLQDTYDMRLMMSELDYQTMYEGAQDNSTLPKKDIVIEDEEVFKLGNTTFNFFITPGHTPGTVSTIFNVHQGGKEYAVAQWGGTGFGFGGATGCAKVAWFEIYAASAQRFQKLIRKHEASVLIANHPGLDNTYDKFKKMEVQDENPWIIGVDGVANYTQTAESCARAGVAAYR